MTNTALGTCLHGHHAHIPGRLTDATCVSPTTMPTAGSTFTLQDVDQVESGSAVYSRDPEPVGTVEQIFAGPDTSAPAWLTIATSDGHDGTVLVPLDGAQFNAGEVIIAYTADQLRDAPTLDAEDDLSRADVARASAHYARTDHKADTP